jgi:hypothetical protein
MIPGLPTWITSANPPGGTTVLEPVPVWNADLGVPADHGDTRARIGRERQRAIVLEQHDPLAGGVERDLVVPGHIHLRRFFPHVHADRVHRAQDPPHHLVPGAIVLSNPASK